METNPIRFEDGDAYERYMGVWSRLAGDAFVDWLTPAADLRWLDVGCGNGAFTAKILDRCAPCAIEGIDPSAAQLAFAHARLASRGAGFRQGDAMSLPFTDDSFDIAVMPLVIFFVPDPAKGVAEMARVVRPGGLVTAYSWDMPGGGFPYEALQAEMRTLGVEPLAPPHPAASRFEVLRELWESAGLESVDTREITVERTFADFEDYWSAILGGPSVGGKIAAMGAAERDTLKQRMRARLPADRDGRIIYGARANAIQGRVPG